MNDFLIPTVLVPFVCGSYRPLPIFVAWFFYPITPLLYPGYKYYHSPFLCIHLEFKALLEWECITTMWIVVANLLPFLLFPTSTLPNLFELSFLQCHRADRFSLPPCFSINLSACNRLGSPHLFLISSLWFYLPSSGVEGKPYDSLRST